MKFIAGRTAGLLAGAALLLSGCGGGVDYALPPPAFDIGALVAGRPVAGVDVTPGFEQTIYLAIGQSFELDSTAPVAWTVEIGGTTIAGSGNTIFYGGATIQETLMTTIQFAANTSSAAALATPVPITILATSLDDPSQVARIDLILTN
jgi:hypothetical protein